MISIPEKVEAIVNQSPYLREAVSNKLINLSALARQIKPQIEAELLKDITTSAVLIALQRYSQTAKPFYAVNPADYLDNLGLRSGLLEITIKNSSALLGKLSSLATSISDQRASLFVFTQGQYETTVITSSSLQTRILDVMQQEIITSTVPDLTAITLQRTHGQIDTTGVLQFPLRILAWEGISVIEIVTTLNEMLILVRNFEVDRAIISVRQALQNVDQQARNNVLS
jgi:hypothetical protein